MPRRSVLPPKLLAELREDQARALQDPLGPEFHEYQEILLVRIRKSPERPIHAALLRALSARLDDLRTLAVSEDERQTRSIMRHVVELTTWVETPIAPSEPKPNLLFGETMAEAMRRHKPLKRRPGRPVVRRLKAVRALEMWLARGRKGWAAVVADFCECSNHRTHDFYCAEALRSEVRKLKRVLGKHPESRHLIEK